MRSTSQYRIAAGPAESTYPGKSIMIWTQPALRRSGTDLSDQREAKQL